MVAAVHCHISNGISLQIFEMKDVGLGVKEAKKKGFTGERADRYVYGAMRASGWAPNREKK